MERIKYFIVTVCGVLAAYFRAYLPLMGAVLCAVMFDIITGVIAAVYTKEGLSSKKARQGAIKKATLFLSLGFGIFLDFLIPFAANTLGMEMGTSLMFSSVIGFYIAFTECVSVCENIYRCDPDAFPDWVKKLLTEGRESIGKGV